MGTVAHLIFMFFGEWVLDLCDLSTESSNGRLATNIIVSSMRILGGSATVTNLSGMNTIAVSSLLGLLLSMSILKTYDML